MTRWWQTSLAAQFISFTVAALIVAQGLTLLVSWDERSKALHAATKSEFFTRAASVTRLMESVPPSLREQALLASETSYTRFWLSDGPQESAARWRGRAAMELSRPLDNWVDLSKKLGVAASGSPRITQQQLANAEEPDWIEPSPVLWNLAQQAKYLNFSNSHGYGLVAALNDGRWLNAAYYKVETTSGWALRSLLSLALTAFILALIGIFIASRIARPLRRLAASAEALGRGENLPPLSEDGPDEIRRTAEAFNRMQGRLHRFVEDRTQMLAAIGHDLRTPLTSLRLRTEFVQDQAIQHKMLSTIDELQKMTEATIAFTRGEATAEETRTMDLGALVGSICDDQADIGHPVTYIEGPKINYRCRPDSLRRAVRNLVENAVRYGGAATVSIRETASTVDISIEDKGPGIPEALREKVFAPFYRLETSRNRDTGGIGLGLSIARAAARQHGGDISFHVRASGMQAVISLPKEGAEARAAYQRRRRFGRSERKTLKEQN